MGLSLEPDEALRLLRRGLRRFDRARGFSDADSRTGERLIAAVMMADGAEAFIDWLTTVIDSLPPDIRSVIRPLHAVPIVPAVSVVPAALLLRCAVCGYDPTVNDPDLATMPPSALRIERANRLHRVHDSRHTPVWVSENAGSGDIA